MNHRLFTSESVSEGHPDKVADQISDTVLDAFLREDLESRVACETLLTKDLVLVAGEVTSKAVVDIPTEVREVIRRIGYDDKEKGLDYKSCSILIATHSQSQDISDGIGTGETQGAGDQGLMFGYAVDETKEYIPLSLSLSHQLMQNLSLLRKNGSFHLWPDSKSQVTVEYDEKGQVVHIPSVLISTQHAPDVELNNLREFIVEELIKKVIPAHLLQREHKFFINPMGRFVIGGPAADCGLTGRKIIVDTYGGHGAHGGGAFSGKDPSKVDRSGAYVARHIAKNIVGAGLAKKCLVQLAYAIGLAKPVSVSVEAYGTLKVSEKKLLSVISKFWDLRPAQIISQYNLLKPIYHQTASYGHFGRKDIDFTWEKLDKVSILRSEFSL